MSQRTSDGLDVPGRTEHDRQDSLAGVDSLAEAHGAYDPEDNHDEDHGEDHGDDHHASSSLANTALWVLVGTLGVIAVTLWAAPRLAPHVPASVGQFLAPVPDLLTTEIAGLKRAAAAREAQLDAEIAALREALAAQAAKPSPGLTEAERLRIGKIEGGLGALSTGVEAADAAADAARAEARAALAAAEQAELRARNAADLADRARTIGEQSAEQAGVTGKGLTAIREDLDLALAGAGDLARRVTSFDAQLAGLAQEVSTLSGSLSEMPDAGAERPAPGELAAALSALQARVDGLRSELAAAPEGVTPDQAEGIVRQAISTAATGLEARIAEARSAIDAQLAADLAAQRGYLETEMARLEARVRAAEETASLSKADALEEAEAALARAALRGARDALSARVAAGEPYAAALAEVETLSGHTAGAALSRHAAVGLPPAADLAERFPPLARAALEAEVRAGTVAEDPSQRVSSWLRSQVFTRPTAEQEGEGLPARLSRIEARLAEDALEAALAETAGLPPRAAAVLADWSAALARRVEAETALAEFVRQDGK
ncbi:MAG: hypothetical protein AAGC57_04360 [Pseudomonadota bacterium]